MADRKTKLNAKDDPLLATKLYIPKPRPELVQRPRLIERLNKVTECKLTLVSAPAGFGKTTLLSEWISQNQQPVAWISLDSGDNDPTRFLNYIIVALQSIEAKLGEAALSLLQSPQPPPFNAIIASLIRDIVSVHDNVILVFDDYHDIETAEIHQMVDLLIDRMPAQMHIVIATRVDPNLPLARLRVRNQLKEIRVIDLCFTIDEAGMFLNKVMRLGLSDQNIEALEARTEGWIAGLQLAALSMRGRSDIPGFIKAFAGDDRLIVDYLVEEVLNLQSADVQDFLLQTSILKQLSEPLCDYITNQQGSQKMLENLERTNLFLVPLDNKRRWYRYHHLFGDLLRQRLQQHKQYRVEELYIRASEWYNTNGFKEDAIECALAAGDFHRTIRLIEGFIDTKWHGTQQVMLLNWLDQLPDEYSQNKPVLGIYHARLIFESGRHEAAEKRIDQIEKIHVHAKKSRQKNIGEQANASKDLETRVLKGKIASVRAYLASRKGDIHDVPKYAEQALAYLPNDDFACRTIVALSSGIAYHVAGDSTAALKAHAEAEAAAKASGSVYFYLMAKIRRIMEMKNTGRLAEAAEISGQLFDEVKGRHPSFKIALGHVYGIHGELLYELNDLREALNCTKKSIAILEQGHDVGVLGWRYCSLMKILCSKGDLSTAREIGRTADSLVRDAVVAPWIMSQIRAAKSKLWLKEGNLNALENWVEKWGLKPDDDNIMVRESEYILYCRFLIAQRRFKDALNLLDRLINQEERGGRVLSQIESRLIQASAFWQQRKTVESMAAVQKAIALAEPGGYVRVFVDEGRAISDMLEKCNDTLEDIPKSFVSKLITTRRLNQALESDHCQVEQLSDRELEVLRFIAAGLPNKKITEKLFISLSTVKTHLRNIYGKLDVHSRTEAIVKAKELDLLN